MSEAVQVCNRDGDTLELLRPSPQEGQAPFLLACPLSYLPKALSNSATAYNCLETCFEGQLYVQRLVEMKAMNAERTRGEREKKERRRQDKEAARLQQQ